MSLNRIFQLSPPSIWVNSGYVITTTNKCRSWTTVLLGGRRYDREQSITTSQGRIQEEGLGASTLFLLFK